MASWAGDRGLEALIAVDPLVEYPASWVKHVKDRISIHLLTCRVDTDLEVRLGAPQ